MRAPYIPWWVITAYNYSFKRLFILAARSDLAFNGRLLLYGQVDSTFEGAFNNLAFYVRSDFSRLLIGRAVVSVVTELLAVITLRFCCYRVNGGY